MPPIAFTRLRLNAQGYAEPVDGPPVAFSEAADYFESEGIVPREMIGLLTHELAEQSTSDPRYIYPSILDPHANCPREIVLDRFLPYVVNPLDYFERKEGQLWHDAMLMGTPSEALRLPPATLPGTESAVPFLKQCEDGKWRIEVFPGVWMRMLLDRLPHGGVLIDHKSKKYPKVYGGKGKSDFLPREWGDEGDKNKVQLNTYRYAWEMCCPDDPIKEMWIWRFYRGSHNSLATFRRCPVPLLPKDLIWGQIESYVRRVQAALSMAYEIREECKAKGEDPEPKIREFAGTIPMDGRNKQMFNGAKCTQYCGVNKLCEELEVGKGTAFDF